MPKVEGECIRGVRAGGYPQGAGTSPAPRCGATASPPRGARAGSGGGLDRGPLFVRQGVAPCLLGVGESLRDEAGVALQLVLGAAPPAHPPVCRADPPNGCHAAATEPSGPGRRGPDSATVLDSGRLAQLGEHQLDKLGVTGSSPVAPTYETRWKRRVSSLPRLRSFDRLRHRQRLVCAHSCPFNGPLERLPLLRGQPLAVLHDLRVDRERERRVFVPDLRRDVHRVVAGGTRSDANVRRRPCGATLPIGSMPSFASRTFAFSIARRSSRRRTFCRQSFSPFSVGNTRSVGSLNRERSSHNASSSRRAGVEVDDPHPRVRLRLLDRQCAAGEVHVAALQVEGLLDPQACTCERREQRPPAAMQVRLRGLQQRHQLLRLHEPAAPPGALEPASPAARGVAGEHPVLDGDLQDLREPDERLVRRVRGQTERHALLTGGPAGVERRTLSVPSWPCSGRPRGR